MKIKNYWYTSDAALQKQYLDRWQTFSQIVDNNYLTTGQTLFKKQQWLNAGGTVTVVAATGVATTVGATTLTAVPAGGLVQINGVIYTSPTAIAAGAAAGAQPAFANVTVANVTGTAANSWVLTQQGLSVTTQQYVNTVDTLSIKAHGINIYDVFPEQFYNSYTTYNYGGPNINTPKDTGLMLVPFCLFPGTYQPSGHINVSRAREFYLTYTSSVINAGVEGSLVVVASAINFLLISDGSAVLRYST